jgi:hypothetical protein
MSDWINLGTLQGEPVPAIVLYPGDRVLVSLHVPALSQKEAHDLQEKLGERFPGVTFTLITGAAQLAVMRGEVGEPMPTGEAFLDTFDSPDLVSTEHGGGRGILKWQRDKARRELAEARAAAAEATRFAEEKEREHVAAGCRIRVLQQELNENGVHFDAAVQEYRREIEQLKVDKEAAEATEDRLRKENRQLWDRLDEASRQLHDMLGRRIIIDNPAPREDHRKVTKERTQARIQRDRLILAIRNHLNGNCGRNTTHLHDVVDTVEREISETRE